ncbi:MAG TPA: VIT1/CCC1 family protein [Anaerolineaceae bacterium]|nr:VIT1/CCC1 family protein [Anaerolineaceae bacterium]HPN53959.1 VIT1/CCC1 family protein [Anaerolineaceae bacterium]
MAALKEVQLYRENFQNEVDSAFLYRTLAGLEKQENLSQVYLHMAQAEEEHTGFWEKKLADAGAPVKGRKPTWRAQALAVLAKQFGPGFVLPTLIGKEKDGGNAYSGQEEARETTMAAEERSHERLLTTIVSKSRGGMEGGMLAALEGRHRSGGGNALRAAVLGANDGLVSNLSLVMGVAGADLSGHTILITGLAGLLAGAGSMALGEWLSVQSSRELYAHQIEIEKRELALIPEEEQAELALIYQAKGLSREAAQDLAKKIMENESSTLDTLAREELGVDPEELGGSAWEAAFTSFFLFAIGAIIPVAPFIFTSGMTAIFISLAVSALGLFGIGAAITLLTGRNVFVSGFRQVLFGLVAAGLTFVIGRIIGVSISG